MVDWKNISIADDFSHHIKNGIPYYSARFLFVGKFHKPGLAPVCDASGAYHINLNGFPVYSQRHIRTFGFYEGLAAVQSHDGWFHILPNGHPLYSDKFVWCGNFQDSRCTVRTETNEYYHIDANGRPVYNERYRYAGDFRDSIAVVQREDGLHAHIDKAGNLLNGKWFLDLDVFHKGFARACDDNGWVHIDRYGNPVYPARYQMIEPFYNGQARVKDVDNSLLIINENGSILLKLK